MPKTWFEEQQVRQAEQEWQTTNKQKPTFDSFKSYYDAHPQYKAHPDYINMLLNKDKPDHQYYFPGDGYIEGGYVIAFLRDNNSNGHHCMCGNCWSVVVNDGDDMYIVKDCPSYNDALAEIKALVNLVPFHFSELVAFGYIYE